MELENKLIYYTIDVFEISDDNKSKKYIMFDTRNSSARDKLKNLFEMSKFVIYPHKEEGNENFYKSMNYEWLELNFDIIFNLCFKITFINIEEFKVLQDWNINNYFYLISKTGMNLILSKDTGIYIKDGADVTMARIHIDSKENRNTIIQVNRACLEFYIGSIFRGYDYNLDIRIGRGSKCKFKNSVIYCGNCKTIKTNQFIVQETNSGLEFENCIFKNKAVTENINRSNCIIGGYLLLSDCVFEKIDESHQSKIYFYFNNKSRFEIKNTQFKRYDWIKVGRESQGVIKNCVFKDDFVSYDYKTPIIQLENDAILEIVDTNFEIIKGKGSRIATIIKCQSKSRLLMENCNLEEKFQYKHIIGSESDNAFISILGSAFCHIEKCKFRNNTNCHECVRGTETIMVKDNSTLIVKDSIFEKDVNCIGRHIVSNNRRIISDNNIFDGESDSFDGNICFL